MLISVAAGELWQIEVSTEKLERLPASAPAEYVAYPTDGSRLAVGSGDHPIRSVDGIPVGEGKRGSITRRLQKKFLQLAHPGEDEDLTTPAIA